MTGRGKIDLTKVANPREENVIPWATSSNLGLEKFRRDRLKRPFNRGDVPGGGKKDEPDTKIGHFKIQLTSEFIRFVQSEEAMSLEFAMTVI
jgi:hypothetical protein